MLIIYRNKGWSSYERKAKIRIAWKCRDFISLLLSVWILWSLFLILHISLWNCCQLDVKFVFLVVHSNESKLDRHFLSAIICFIKVLESQNVLPWNRMGSSMNAFSLGFYLYSMFLIISHFGFYKAHAWLNWLEKMEENKSFACNNIIFWPTF